MSTGVACCTCGCGAYCFFRFQSTFYCPDGATTGSWTTPVLIGTACCLSGETIGVWDIVTSADSCTATIWVSSSQTCPGEGDTTGCTPPATPSPPNDNCRDCTPVPPCDFVCLRRYVAQWNCEEPSEDKWQISHDDHACVALPIDTDEYPTSWVPLEDVDCHWIKWVRPDEDHNQCCSSEEASDDECDEREYTQPAPPGDHDGCDCCETVYECPPGLPSSLTLTVTITQTAPPVDCSAVVTITLAGADCTYAGSMEYTCGAGTLQAYASLVIDGGGWLLTIDSGLSTRYMTQHSVCVSDPRDYDWQDDLTGLAKFTDISVS